MVLISRVEPVRILLSGIPHFGNAENHHGAKTKHSGTTYADGNQGLDCHVDWSRREKVGRSIQMVLPVRYLNMASKRESRWLGLAYIGVRDILANAHDHQIPYYSVKFEVNFHSFLTSRCGCKCKRRWAALRKVLRVLT